MKKQQSLIYNIIEELDKKREADINKKTKALLNKRTLRVKSIFAPIL